MALSCGGKWPLLTPAAAPVIPQSPAATGAGRSDYLPDFCEPQAVLTVVLVSALLAIVVALAQYGARDDFLLALARTSGYLLWNGLLCALVLCKSRPWLARHSLRASTISRWAWSSSPLRSFPKPLTGSDAHGKASSACPQEFSRASTGNSCCPMSASRRSSGCWRCGTSMWPINGAATSSSRRAHGSARSRRASVRTSCSTA